MSVPVAGGPVRSVAAGSDPAVSPDGRMLAYVTGAEPHRGPEAIVVRNLATGSQRRWAFISDQADIVSLSWSPDGCCCRSPPSSARRSRRPPGCSTSGGPARSTAPGRRHPGPDRRQGTRPGRGRRAHGRPAHRNHGPDLTRAADMADTGSRARSAARSDDSRPFTERPYCNALETAPCLDRGVTGCGYQPDNGSGLLPDPKHHAKTTGAHAPSGCRRVQRVTKDPRIRVWVCAGRGRLHPIADGLGDRRATVK